MPAGTRADGTVLAAPPRGRHRALAGVALIVLAAVVAMVSTRASEGASAWVARVPVAAGAPVSADDFVPAELTVPDPAALWPGTTAPAGSANRTISAGEPLLATDLAASPVADGRVVSLAMPASRLPVSVQVGDEVDVWVGGDGSARLALQGVLVAAVAAHPELSAEAQVEVLVAAADSEPAVAAALARDVVVVPRR